MKRCYHVLLALAFLLSAAVSAWATNGMNMIGYGAVSAGMGGADLAVVDNASAMNINPAGICSCEGPQFGVGVSALMPGVHHRDGANDIDSKDQVFPLPLLTYATPVDATPLTFGLGVFAQGGMGVDYQGAYVVMPGVTDQVYSNVAYMKVNPTLAWQSRDTRLKIGASLNIGKVDTDIEYFPNNGGFKVGGLSANGYGARLGFQYRIDDLVIGGAWLSRTGLSFKDGDLIMGGTTYEAEMEGFDWPQQVGLGVAYNFGYTFRVALDVDWIEWSQAVDRVVIDYGSGSIPFSMDWQDQWVFAVGAEWEFVDGWLARVGYNHGDSVVPDETLSPLFPAIVEDHVTLGFGYRARGWQFDAAYEHGFEAEQTNPLSGGTETHEQNTVHLLMTWFF